MQMTEAEIRAQLAALGERGGDQLDIGVAALLLANLDLPDRDLAEYHKELGMIVADLRTAAHGADSLVEQSAALSQTLYERHQFQGDTETYDDPQNANLMRVMDRRKGLPVALGILAIHAGRAMGWEIAGLNFPGHFLLRLGPAGAHVLIDPFDQGGLVGGDDLERIFRRVHNQPLPPGTDFIQTVSDRNILVRLQNNIKVRALGEGNRDRAIEILRSIVLITPAQLEFLTELILMEASCGHIMSALGRLDVFTARYPEAAHAAQLSALKEKLNRNLN
jgi:regulator of sirC expression with transglutaminase-like and TPR domain